MGGHDDSLPLFKGTLDLLVLKALSFGAQHGYGIVTWLEARSGGSIDVDDSALYQALHRLEGRRLVEAEWGVSDNNRRARFYRLTDAGEARLDAESARWRAHARAVGRLLSPG